MNESHRELGVLAEQIKKTFRRKTGFKIELRAAPQTAGHEIASRLLTALRLGGLDVSLVEVPSTPRDDILVETSHETAGLALALQSAFLATHTSVQLLVRNKAQPRIIIIHVGSQSPK